MQQPKPLSSLIAQTTATPPTTSYVSRQLPSLPAEKKKGELVKRKFGERQNFLSTVNPDTQVFFGRNTEAAVMGDYPTLNDINAAYGKDFAVDWLMPQIASIATHTGAKNLTIDQAHELARIIAAEYHYFKITELLMFFYRFKAGHYGRFYGSVDPMVITCAIREFKRERNELIGIYEQQKREAAEAEDRKRNPPMSRDEWMELKTIIAMYNPDYTV